MLLKKKKYIVSIFLTTFIVFFTYISGYADENSAPVFIDGNRAIRTIPENTPAGVNIGEPVAATDADNDTLTYTKGWLDGTAFTVDSNTGQIRTKASLDYETKNLYSFAIFADDGNGGSRVISVTVNVTDVDEASANNAPTFTDGDSATRSVAENTASGGNIGSAVAATDADDDTLTYTLGGTDAASFSIVKSSGQLQTNAELDAETKSTYTVKVAVSDGKGGTDSITVTINVTDVAGAAPSLETSPVIPENTALLTNFPNPFNPETWIPYQLAKPAEVTLTIYDIRGRVVRKLALGHQPAGMYRSRSRAIHWDGRNAIGEKVASGIYFYTLKAGDFMATQKLLIRK